MSLGNSEPYEKIDSDTFYSILYSIKSDWKFVHTKQEEKETIKKTN